MKSTLLLLAAFTLPAAAATDGTGALKESPDASPANVLKEPSQNGYWLPKIIKYYDEDGNFKYQNEITYNAKGQRIYNFITSADGSDGRTTCTRNDQGWPTEELFEQKKDGEWKTWRKYADEYDEWGNLTVSVTENYNINDGSISSASKMIYTRDTTATGDTYFKSDYYIIDKWNPDWTLQTITERREQFDAKGRCVQITTQSENPSRPGSKGSSTKTVFLYKGDTMAPFYCEYTVNDTTKTIYSDLVWSSYNKAVRSNYPKDWIVRSIHGQSMSFDNQLASATILYQNNSNLEKQTGSIEVTYSDNGFVYKLKGAGDHKSRIYKDEMGTEEQTGRTVENTYDITFTDTNNNGNYETGEPFDTYTTYSHAVNDPNTSFTFAGYYNSSFNSIHYFKINKYNFEKQCWEEYENSYLWTGTDRPSSKRYTKQVVTEYTFISAPSGINAVSTSKGALQAVYNLQGMKVGDSVDNLPAGIYIVKNGDKTKKIIKK